jgi:hypothetical protein
MYIPAPLPFQIPSLPSPLNSSIVSTLIVSSNLQSWSARSYTYCCFSPLFFSPFTTTCPQQAHTTSCKPYPLIILYIFSDVQNQVWNIRENIQKYSMQLFKLQKAFWVVRRKICMQLCCPQLMQFLFFNSQMCAKACHLSLWSVSTVMSSGLPA